MNLGLMLYGSDRYVISMLILQMAQHAAPDSQLTDNMGFLEPSI